MMAMPCDSCRALNIADVLGLINEVNLMAFDFKSPSRSKLVVPNLLPFVRGGAVSFFLLVLFAVAVVVTKD